MTIPEDVKKLAYDTLDAMLCECTESGGVMYRRRDAIEKIAHAILADREARSGSVQENENFTEALKIIKGLAEAYGEIFTAHKGQGTWYSAALGFLEMQQQVQSPSREEIQGEKLDWKNGKARSPLGDLYEVCQLSPHVWVTCKNDTEIATWKSSESLARGVAQADFDRLKKASKAPSKGKSYHVVFDKFPDHYAPRFIELEDDNGRSISAVEWKRRDDGLVELVLPIEGIPDTSALLREAEKALEPFAYVAEHDIGEDEFDDDVFRPVSAKNARAQLINVGHFRAARSTLAKIRGNTNANT